MAVSDVSCALIPFGVIDFIVSNSIEEVVDSVGVALGVILELVYRAVFENNPKFTSGHICVVLKINRKRLSLFVVSATNQTTY